MTADPGYDGEGDFALYYSLKPDPEEDADFGRVVRSINRDALLEQAEQLWRGGSYKYVGVWCWNYDAGQDDILIEEWP